MRSDCPSDPENSTAANTSFYFYYCYSNEPGNLGCTTQLLLVISTLLTLVPVCILLKRYIYEPERQILKILTLSLMMTLEIVVFFHYFLVIKNQQVDQGLITAQ